MIKDPNYKFKNKENLDKLEKTVKNIEHDIKYYFKDRTNLQPILSRYRQISKITPKALRDNIDNKYAEDIEFIVYISLNFTSISEETLIQELNISDMEKIKNDKSLCQKYEQKVKIFFEKYKEGYLSNEYQHLCFVDSMADYFRQT